MLAPTKKQEEKIAEINAYLEKYPNKTRTEVSKALGVAFGTLDTYEANGWVKLPAKLSAEQARKKSLKGWGNVNITRKKRVDIL